MGIIKNPRFTGILDYKKVFLGQDNTPSVGDHGMAMMS